MPHTFASAASSSKSDQYKTISFHLMLKLLVRFELLAVMAASGPTVEWEGCMCPGAGKAEGAQALAKEVIDMTL